MTRYRLGAVLLLFLLLNLTACSSWQSIGPVSPSRFIELDQPERVRVYMRGGDQVELERPAVDGDELVSRPIIRLDGDELVAPGGFSMPLVDVLALEVRRFDVARTILRVGGGATAAFVVYVGLCWPDDPYPPGGPIC